MVDAAAVTVTVTVTVEEEATMMHNIEKGKCYKQSKTDVSDADQR